MEEIFLLLREIFGDIPASNPKFPEYLMHRLDGDIQGRTEMGIDVRISIHHLREVQKLLRGFKMNSHVLFSMIESGWMPCFDSSSKIAWSKNWKWMVVHNILFPLKDK